MELQKLILHNFKGITDFTLEAGGRSLNVYGANESGKTTLADAQRWLLIDKDTAGKSPLAFGIKTRERTNGKLGKVQHGLEHSVEGVYDIVTLKKVYKENWTKSRGTKEKVHKGHTTDYYVDGVPVKQNEYEKAVQEIMSLELFDILTQPTYFAEELHWSDRRRILTGAAGEITTEEIINADPELARYPDVLGNKSEEGIKKILTNARKDLLEDIEDIPVRIDEATRQLVEIQKSEDEINAEIAIRDKQRTEFEQQLSKLKSGGGVADLKIRIDEIEAEKSKLKTEHQKQEDQQLQQYREKVNDLQNRLDTLMPDLREAQRKAEHQEAALKAWLQKVEEKKKLLKEAQDRTPQPKREPDKPKACPMGCSPNCPECGANLLLAKDTEADKYDVYLKKFNSEKAADIKIAKEKLVAAEEQIKDFQLDYEDAKQVWAKLKAKENQIRPALQRAEEQIQQQKQSITPVTELEAYQTLTEDQNVLQRKIDSFNTERQAEVEKVQAQDAEVKAEQTKWVELYMQHKANKRIHKRIAELNGERDEAVKKLEQVEEDLHLLDQFEIQRSRIVTDRVNQQFQHVTWRMFKYQVDGKVNPDVCEAVYKGIPFNEGLNYAGKMQAGIDIINTLSKHFEKSAPVFIDNRESVYEIPKNDLQIINLYHLQELTETGDMKLHVDRA